jgi:hypothetical protein
VQLTPEMIDSLVMQLKMAMQHADHLPPDVQETGKEFLNALDRWSDRLRKGTQIEHHSAST